MKTVLLGVAHSTAKRFSFTSLSKRTNSNVLCQGIANRPFRPFSSLRRAAAALTTTSLLLLPSCQGFLIPHHHQQPNKQSCNTRPFFSFSSMSTHITERDGSGTIIVSPKNEASQSGLIVICHGLGDTGEGFADVAEQFASQMPHLKFVLPTAPTQPVTMNMGMPMPSWYDIVGLDERSNENCKGIEESQAKIKAILQKEHEETGLPYSRMLLAGFSQGGALSLFTGLQMEEQLAGIIVWSGYLPAASKLQVKQPKTKIWHGHGTQDPLVQYTMAEKTKYLLLEKGVEDYDLHSYPIPHTVSPAELREAMAFLMSVLPPDESFQVQLKDPSTMSIKELKGAIRKAGLGNKAVGLMEKGEFVKLLQDHRAGKL